MKLITFLGRIIFIITLLFALLITGCDSGSDDTELGDSWLKIAGEEYSMAKLKITNDGESSVPGVYEHYVTISSENLDLSEGTGSGEAITVVLFSTSNDLPQDDYDFSSGDPESGKFISSITYDAYILTDFVFPDPDPTEYQITGGTITVNIIDTTYYISGNVDTDGGAAAFRYVGEATVVGE
ncbi:MAG: hypothetical protein H7A26_02205 [Spirochaetales bacterium]|nr:hypothetical protein [Spirochaetales bacterium]